MQGKDSVTADIIFSQDEPPKPVPQPSDLGVFSFLQGTPRDTSSQGDVQNFVPFWGMFGGNESQRGQETEDREQRKDGVPASNQGNKYDISEMEKRIAQLEAKAKGGTENGKGTKQRIRVQALDELCRFDDPDSNDDDDFISKLKCNIPNVCLQLWGGPIMPSNDQNLWTWLENFFGGITTAHGINQVFKEHNGVVRRIFWLLAVCLAYLGVFLFCFDAIFDYTDAITADTVSTDTHSGVLPLVTVCNMNPVRCGCSAFYDPALLASPDLVKKVLPYVCSSAVAFQKDSWEPMDPTGKVESWNILEDAIAFVDIEATTALLQAFSDKIDCDNGAYTAASVVAKILEGNLTFFDLYAYAGYSTRTNLVRGCMAVDPDVGSPTGGQSVACMDDTWWAPVMYDTDYGACHTFNPCQGFPVGDSCDSNADCQHVADGALPGGRCVNGACTCTRCAAGQGCRVARQLIPGRLNGIRLVGNVGTDQNPPLSLAANSRWSDGMLVVLHTDYNAGALDGGFVVAPGAKTDVAVGRRSFTSADYPYTNCSNFVGVDTGVCQTNCLRRIQAITCCNLTNATNITKGRLSPLTVADPAGGRVAVTDPRLLCSVLQPGLPDCLDAQVQAAASGLACVEGAIGFNSPYFGGLWKRTNWYTSEDVTSDNQIGAQELASLAIKKQCLWSEADDNLGEARYGKPCKTDADCPSSTGGSNGTCGIASRAYCPERCYYYEYTVKSINAGTLSYPTIQTIAADELAQVTAQHALAPDAPQRWKPRCGGPNVTDGDPCITDEQAQELVKEHYALVNIDFVDFDVEVNEHAEGISTATLLGTVGGNMGLFMGISVMTMLEWVEALFWAVVAMPFFYIGISCGPFIRKIPPADPNEEGNWPELQDPNVHQVLCNIKDIVKRRKGDEVPPADEAAKDSEEADDTKDKTEEKINDSEQHTKDETEKAKDSGDNAKDAEKTAKATKGDTNDGDSKEVAKGSEDNTSTKESKETAKDSEDIAKDSKETANDSEEKADKEADDATEVVTKDTEPVKEASKEEASADTKSPDMAREDTNLKEGASAAGNESARKDKPEVDEEIKTKSSKDVKEADNEPATDSKVVPGADSKAGSDRQDSARRSLKLALPRGKGNNA